MSEIILLHSQVKMPLMSLPVATPVIKIGSRTIMISPGSQLTQEQVQQYGPITDIIAPNLLHSGGVMKVHQLYPQAKIWGVHGLQKRKPNIPWTDLLNKEHWDLQQELPLIEIRGMPAVNEVVFFEPKSKTLFTTDFGFNMLQQKGLGSWIIQSIFGTYHQFAISRLFTMMIKNRKQFYDSINELFAYDFEKIIMSHGEPIQENARQRLAQALKTRGYHDFNP